MGKLIFVLHERQKMASDSKKLLSDRQTVNKTEIEAWLLLSLSMAGEKTGK